MKRHLITTLVLGGFAAGLAGCDSNPGAPSAPSAPTGADATKGAATSNPSLPPIEKAKGRATAAPKPAGIAD